MYISDEDSDVIGFKIKEIYNTAGNESQIIEETYPLFWHSPLPSVWLCQFPIQVRTTGTGKDNELWERYMDDNSRKKILQIIASMLIQM